MQCYVCSSDLIEDSFATFKIYLDRPHFDPYPRPNGSDLVPAELMMLFPLVSEDPLIFQRKAKTLSEVGYNV